MVGPSQCNYQSGATSTCLFLPCDYILGAAFSRCKLVLLNAACRARFMLAEVPAFLCVHTRVNKTRKYPYKQLLGTKALEIIPPSFLSWVSTPLTRYCEDVNKYFTFKLHYLPRCGKDFPLLSIWRFNTPWKQNPRLSDLSTSSKALECAEWHLGNFLLGRKKMEGNFLPPAQEIRADMNWATISHHSFVRELSMCSIPTCWKESLIAQFPTCIFPEVYLSGQHWHSNSRLRTAVSGSGSSPSSGASLSDWWENTWSSHSEQPYTELCNHLI